MNTVQATLTRTWDNQPLVTLDGGPFNGVERTPAQLRALAATLVRTANLAQMRPTTGRHWAPQTVVLDLAIALQTNGGETALNTWEVRRVHADLSITYAGERWGVMHLPEVLPGDLVTVRRGAPGCAPEIRAANAQPQDTSASPSEPAHSRPRSGPSAGIEANSDSQTTHGAPPPLCACPAPHGHGTPQTPSDASPQAHSHSHSADTAGAAPGADPISTLVALAQRLAPARGSQGTGTWQQGRVSVSLHFSGGGVDEPTLCNAQTTCAACKTGFCLATPAPEGRA